MRLHRLAIQAFGPFAEREEIDFDAISGSGLFLLHGPTGAGKTSVLDAVCFALYGVVPGARSRTGRLRSDHAVEGLAPEVVCELSIGSRRLEVTRSPAWERPKRRGDGTTTEQARVGVRELVAGEWVPLATRLDEAGLLMESLLGLGHDQFTKLVLLPQGDFAAFLRADAEARRGMLEKLFDTDRFSDVQQFLRDRQAELRKEVNEARTVTREQLARADQACAQLPRIPGEQPSAAALDVQPDAQPDEADAVAVEVEPPADRVSRLLARAVHAWEDDTARRAATQGDLARARAAHQAGLDLAGRQAEHGRLTAVAERLAADAPAQQDRRRRLQEAERALGVAQVAPVLTESEATLDDARVGLDAAVRDAVRDADTLVEEGGLSEALLTRGVLLLDATVLAGLDGTVLTESGRRLREQAGHLQAVGADAAALPAALTAVREQGRRADRARRALDDALAAAAALGPRLVAEQDLLARDTATAAGLPAAVEALAAAEAVAAAVAERRRLGAALDAATATRDRARDRRDRAREHWLDCRERRLAHIAAELAEALADGQPCPVCGGTEHPRPARSGPDRVTDAQEQKAKDRYDTADAEFARHEATAHALGEELARLAGVTGGLDAPAADQRLTAAQAAVEDSRQATERIPDREATVRGLTEEVERAGQLIETARDRLHELETELATRSAAAEELRSRVDAARGADPSVQARQARLTTGAEYLDSVLDARRRHTDALRAAATARRTALAATREAGFGDLAGLLAAVLPEPERLELESAVRAHDSELAAVTARLADPALAAAADQPTPDLVELGSAEVQAQGDDEACAQRIAIAERAVDQMRGIQAELAEHLLAAQPLESRYRTVAELARCADGTGGDNARRMSLSAYVLAARLEQIAQAASLRLAQMSGGRYTLVHTDEPARGQRRSGLGLHVVDAWTGQRRDTTSLSGGESFYTSLALALGLADVASAEAGGTVIETLFVDEGFGTLDEDTLEEVMDVLDGLRSGGRSVGLVSHVADLRARIPAQIEVIKGRDGSHLAVAAG